MTDEHPGADRHRPTPAARDEGTAEAEAIDVWRDLGGGRPLPTDDTVLCVRCRLARVEVAWTVRRLQRSLGRVLRARGERPLGDDELVMCAPCVERTRVVLDQEGQRQHDEWTRLWHRFKARGVEYHELPEAMREAWDRVLKAELAKRGQITGRKQGPGGLD